MLLNSYKHHHVYTVIMLTIFLLMSRPRSIYVLSVYVIYFSYSSSFKKYKISCYFAYFLEYVILFLDDNVNEVRE